MEWLQVLTIAGSTLGAVWFMHKENISMWNKSNDEMKDFHGRLCILEEKYRQMMERFLNERNK